jgi:opacity protein-like surface antigen
MSRLGVLSLALTVCLTAAVPAAAQTANRPQPAPRPATSVRVFADLGYTTFTAADSFEATLGSPGGPIVGAGAEVVLPQKIFVNLRFSRFTGDGERVFINNSETFGLGIPMTVKVTPVLLSAGYRFGTTRSMLIPYAGGGIGWYKYEETSDFAEAGEDVSERFTGYHLLGGAEYRLSRLFAVAGEAQWAAVPDALGDNPNSASGAFGESDLGGFTVRVKFVVGM